MFNGDVPKFHVVADSIKEAVYPSETIQPLFNVLIYYLYIASACKLFQMLPNRVYQSHNKSTDRQVFLNFSAGPTKQTGDGDIKCLLMTTIFNVVMS